MLATDFLPFNKKKETEYFTKGAEIYDAVKTGVCRTQLQQDFAKLSEYEQAAVVESIFANLHKVATREAWYIINTYKFDSKKLEDLVSIIDEKMVEIFDLYNKSADTNYTISTYIGIYKFEYIRSLMGEEKSLTEARIKNLSAIHRTMSEIMNEDEIDSEDITAEMVKERMDEKWPSHPLSIGLIQSMMDWIKGSLSIEEMAKVNDIRLTDPILTTEFSENDINVSNLDARTREYFLSL